MLQRFDKDRLILLFFGMLLFINYFCNLGVNDIWAPNESFYAEAVREMLESGNYLEFFYNYDPRYNKPPLVYWIIALSASVFGLSEWAIRLPIALLGVGTILLTGAMGRLLGGRRLAIAAALVMAFSFQFVINARYASPEVPLTFFFALTLYFFLRGYLRKDRLFVWLAYLALGLTMLTKGYPYLVIISLIIVVFLLLQAKFDLKKFSRTFTWLQPWWGLPLAALVGFSWILYMIGTQGQGFYEVFMDETFRRAFTRRESLRPMFYIVANIWGFLPFSLTFYFGLAYLVFNRFREMESEPVLQFSISWFLVMLIVFTVAKGKIPTYFIQGYPGMSLFTAYFLTKLNFTEIRWKRLYQVQFILPAFCFSLLSAAIIYVFKMPVAVYILPALPLAGAWHARKKSDLHLAGLRYLPFSTFAITHLIFVWLALPQIETGYRNHDELGKAVRERVTDQSLPLLMEETLIHNLPFYIRRKAVPYLSREEIELFDQQGPLLVLAPKEHRTDYPADLQVIWEGLIFEGSESRTLEFILHQLKHRSGQDSKFREYQVLYEPNIP